MDRYTYAEYKSNLFNELGQARFLRIRDTVRARLVEAGAFRMNSVIKEGDFFGYAAVDRMLELGEIIEISPPSVPWQYRVFTTMPQEGG